MSLALNRSQAQAHLRSLAAMAAADGRIDPNEHAFLLMVGARHGIPRPEVEGLLANHGRVLLSPPRDPGLRLQQLVDLVHMMLCDGEIAGSEMMLCQSFARAMGFGPDVVAKITAVTLAAAGTASPVQRQPSVDAESFLSDEVEEVDYAELVFHCPHCAEPFGVTHDLLGETVACHACDGAIVLPENA